MVGEEKNILTIVGFNVGRVKGGGGRLCMCNNKNVDALESLHCESQCSVVVMSEA